VKRFDKYPSVFGKLCLGDLCRVARRHGMYVIAAYKPGMHVYCEIGLYGTDEQMRAVTTEWEAKGNKLKSRSFKAVMGMNSKRISASHWLDIPTAHRDWCPDHNHRNRNHCDFDPKLSLRSRVQLEEMRIRVLKREATKETK
jgi:hypothetical protein